MQAASQQNLEGLLSVVEKAGESFDLQTVDAALQQVRRSAAMQCLCCGSEPLLLRPCDRVKQLAYCLATTAS